MTTTVSTNFAYSLANSFRRVLLSPYNILLQCLFSLLPTPLCKRQGLKLRRALARRNFCIDYCQLLNEPPSITLVYYYLL